LACRGAHQSTEYLERFETFMFNATHTNNAHVRSYRITPPTDAAGAMPLLCNAAVASSDVDARPLYEEVLLLPLELKGVSALLFYLIRSVS
jgi:CxxC motif-containing protein (DUF1111 family)